MVGLAGVSRWQDEFASLRSGIPEVYDFDVISCLPCWHHWQKPHPVTLFGLALTSWTLYLSYRLLFSYLASVTAL